MFPLNNWRAQLLLSLQIFSSAGAEPSIFFSKSSKATKNQRENYELSGGGTGIHWDDIDEDISVNGLLLGIGDKAAQDAEAA